MYPDENAVSRPAADAERAGIRYELHGSSAWLVIDNPGARNALTAAMLESVPELVHSAMIDPAVRSVVVAGRGPRFSAGADIQDILGILGARKGGVPSGGVLSVAAQALENCPKPTLAAMEGPCMGGAWMLAAACDLRIGSSTATIGLTPVKLGVLYPYAGIVRLVRLVGEGAANDLLLTGRTVNADEALRLGLLTEVVPESSAKAVMERCESLAELSQLSVRGHKELIRLAITEPDTASIPEAALHWYQDMANCGDAQEGVRAFFARERPQFHEFMLKDRGVGVR